jgi:hypothetical protein
MVLGKAAIIRAILEAEKNSKLFVDQSNFYNKLDFGSIEGTWFLKLMRVLGPGGSPAEVAKGFRAARVHCIQLRSMRGAFPGARVTSPLRH